MLKALRSNARRYLSTHGIVRILIASYFIALSLSLIPGTDVSVLLAPFVSPELSVLLTHAAVLALSLMILVDLQRRAAALLLSLMIFWSSYMTLMSLPSLDVLGGFWRDLALIGALVMTYSGGGAGRGSPTTGRKHGDANASAAADAYAATARVGMIGRISRPLSRHRDDVEERFREDLTAARVS